MKNKLPFTVGDILFNSISKKFIYICESKFRKNTMSLIDYTFSIIGYPNEKFETYYTVEDLSLFMTRYGNISDINMTVDELNSIRIADGDSTEEGLRMDKLTRDIKMNFLLSY